MLQILEITKDFDICGGLNPGTPSYFQATSLRDRAPKLLPKLLLSETARHN